MLDFLDEIDEYQRHFMDAVIWEPFVREVCKRHGQPCGRVNTGVAGTYPTFIVDEKVVVKFFGTLFDGVRSFHVEREANRIIESLSIIRAPRILFTGALFQGKDGKNWPYLVFEYLPGRSMGEEFEHFPLDQKMRLAGELGQQVRRLHGVGLPGSELFPKNWDGYLSFLERQKQTCKENQRKWGSLPLHLIEQIDGYLPPVESLVDTTAIPHLIHADLTGDHIFCKETGRGWEMYGIIDWGDAMVGNILYELVALFIGLFRCQKSLLRAFLEEYGLPEFFRDDFARRVGSAALMHQFDVMGTVFRHVPRARECATLEELGELVWGG